MPLDKLQFFGRVLLASSLVYLASALIQFVDEAALFRASIANLAIQVEKAGGAVDIPRVLDQVDAVTREVEETRKLLPSLLQQVEQTRQLVPPILDEVARVRQEIPGIVAQIEGARKLVPGVLEEVAAVRGDVPQILDKTQRIIVDAQKISSDMGTGAVHGTIKGVVTAPFKLIETGVEVVTEEAGKLGKKMLPGKAPGQVDNDNTVSKEPRE